MPTPRSDPDSVILVVDDEPDMRFFVRESLSSPSYEVVEAAHGGQALAKIRESRPDLIITDLMMPVMGGHELICRLRAVPEMRDIPIIQVSARIDPELVTDAAFTKPFQPDELLAMARRLLGGSSSAR